MELTMTVRCASCTDVFLVDVEPDEHGDYRYTPPERCQCGAVDWRVTATWSELPERSDGEAE